MSGRVRPPAAQRRVQHRGRAAAVRRRAGGQRGERRGEVRQARLVLRDYPQLVRRAGPKGVKERHAVPASAAVDERPRLLRAGIPRGPSRAAGSPRCRPRGTGNGCAGSRANALRGALALTAVPAAAIRCTSAEPPLPSGHVQHRHVIRAAIARDRRAANTTGPGPMAGEGRCGRPAPTPVAPPRPGQRAPG